MKREIIRVEPLATYLEKYKAPASMVTKHGDYLRLRLSALRSANVTLSVPDPNHINSFMNFRVADIQACYKLWKSRGAEFITEPIPKYGEIRCYIRDPDGYIIEVGQSTDLTYG